MSGNDETTTATPTTADEEWELDRRGRQAGRLVDRARQRHKEAKWDLGDGMWRFSEFKREDWDGGCGQWFEHLADENGETGEVVQVVDGHAKMFTVVYDDDADVHRWLSVVILEAQP